MEAATRRILVVANRTAATPLLIETVRTRAAEGRCTFALLIPNEPRKGGADWTLETAIPLLERAAGGPVEGIIGKEDAFEAVESALQDPGFDEVQALSLAHLTGAFGGEGPLLWSQARGIDPTPVRAIEDFKRALG